MITLETNTWPADRLHIALRELAERAGLPLAGGGAQAAPPVGVRADEEGLDQWLAAAAAGGGQRAVHFRLRHGDVAGALAAGEPLLVAVPAAEPDAPPRFAAVVDGNGRRVKLLGPDGRVGRVSTEALRRAIGAAGEAPYRESLARTVRAAGSDPDKRPELLQGLLDRRLAGMPLTWGWHLRPGDDAPLLNHARRMGLLSPAVLFMLTHTLQYLYWLVSWWILGRAVLQGRFEPGWLAAWLLALAMIVPLRTAAAWFQGRFAIGAGGLIKKRLLAGALRLEPDAIRHQGSGQLIGRVLESEAIETMLLGGGFKTLSGLIEVLLSLLVLAAGRLPLAHPLLLVGWLGVTGLLSWRFWRRRRAWAAARLSLTHHLVEQMNGHRTRLAQGDPAAWHRGEDDELFDYVNLSAGMDRSAGRLLALITHGWLLLGGAALAVPFVTQQSGEEASLAIAVGGLLSAAMGLNKIVNGLLQLSDAGAAVEQVRDLLEAAGRGAPAGTPALAVRRPPVGGESPLLAAHQLTFRYRPHGRPVLAGVDAAIFPGDRILLESVSGGGKSTLAAVLAGLRQPEAGLVLLNGLDRETIGPAGWRRAIATAPQFHENHVVLGTFAFNLLLGRRWPPSPADLARAEAVCAALGLDELLARMPGGMQQTIGETGWQLSHGERGRLFLARALLQGGDLLILDESFAALDPQNLARCLEVVLAQEAAVLVIAHP